ncbi:hypothetical protein D3C85_1839770 [compost metagenome]
MLGSSLVALLTGTVSFSRLCSSIAMLHRRISCNADYSMVARLRGIVFRIIITGSGIFSVVPVTGNNSMIGSYSYSSA